MSIPPTRPTQKKVLLGVEATPQPNRAHGVGNGTQESLAIDEARVSIEYCTPGARPHHINHTNTTNLPLTKTESYATAHFDFVSRYTIWPKT